MLTMRAGLARYGAAAWIMSSGPCRFVEMTDEKWSAVMSPSAAGGAMPALLMRMSMTSEGGSRQALSFSIISFGPVGEAMSARIFKTDGACSRERMREASSSAWLSLDSLRWWMMIYISMRLPCTELRSLEKSLTSAPSVASFHAIAAPIPRAEPVTSAVLPCKGKSFFTVDILFSLREYSKFRTLSFDMLV